MGGQPYFSVPYSMRAPVNKTVIGLPPAGGTTLPQVAGQPPAAPGKPTLADKAPEKVVGGKLPTGVVEKPILQDQQTAPPRPAEAPPLADKPALPSPALIVDVQPQKGKGDVRFR
ncbi:MAG: hypothetical protein C0405_07430, partial [Desulfovibrio sp.]|nr:hypothetical protein [Desulfovibrio sp.]